MNKLMLFGFGVIFIPVVYVFITLLLFEVTGDDKYIKGSPLIDKVLYRFILFGFLIILLSIIL